MAEQRKRETHKSADRSKAKRKRTRKQVLRNRYIALAVILACVVVLIVFFATRSSGSEEEEELAVSTLTLEEDGSVTLLETEAFEEDYYDADALEEYIDGLISDYNDENGSDAVSLENISVKKKVATVTTHYATVEDYAAFTGTELVLGTVADLKEAYDFKTPFVAVSSGEKGDTVSKNDITAQDALTVLIIRENIRVVVPEEITYISDESTTLVDATTVDIAQIDGNEDVTQEIYILYQ